MKHLNLFTLITILFATNSNVLDYINQSTWTEQCQNEKRGSPINIISKNVTQADVDELSIEFIHYPDLLKNPIKEIFHEKTFMIGYEQVVNNYVLLRKGESIYKFTFVNAHYHCPSEHSVDGVEPNCEMHLVHQRLAYETDSDSMNYLVIGIFFNEKTGVTNPLLNIKTNIDLSTILNINREYYFYEVV
jgi:carbonic anhydrase